MSPAEAQNTTSLYQNTVRIEQDEAISVVVEKSAYVLPTSNQLKALRDEFIAFIHFGPNTFTQKEWGSGTENPKVFDLKNLNTAQWCEALKAAGIKK